MRLTITRRNGDARDEQELRSHIERRVGFALLRFTDALSSVLVRLDDLNGPKGGFDKRCLVHLPGPERGQRHLFAFSAPEAR